MRVAIIALILAIAALGNLLTGLTPLGLFLGFILVALAVGITRP